MSIDASPERESTRILAIAEPYRKMSVVLVATASFDIREGMYPDGATDKEMRKSEQEAVKSDLAAFIEMATLEGTVQVAATIVPMTVGSHG